MALNLLRHLDRGSGAMHTTVSRACGCGGHGRCTGWRTAKRGRREVLPGRPGWRDWDDLP